MIGVCEICGATRQPKLSREETSRAELLYDSLSETADIEGTGILNKTEFAFICGRICNKCFLKFFDKNP